MGGGLEILEGEIAFYERIHKKKRFITIPFKTFKSYKGLKGRSSLSSNFGRLSKLDCFCPYLSVSVLDCVPLLLFLSCRR